MCQNGTATACFDPQRNASSTTPLCMELTSKRPLRPRHLGLSPHEVGYHEGLELLKTLGLLYVRPLSGIGRVLDTGNPWFAVILSAAVTWLQHFPWQALLLIVVIFVPAAVLTAAKLE